MYFFAVFYIKMEAILSKLVFVDVT